MKKTNLTRIVTAALGGGLFLAASCSVDSSDFIFDDDKFDELNGSGGTVSGDGDGDGGMGGQTASGGMGGDTGTGGGPVAMPGDLRCSGKQVEFFAGGTTWAPLGAPCEFLCTAGTCTGDCEPQDTECISGLESRSCSDKAAWSTSTCQFACVGDSCGGSCVPGSRQCDDKQKQLCSEQGEWQDDGSECLSGCSASQDGLSAACTGPCTDGDTQCLDIKQRQTCQSMAWTSDAALCPFACLDGECGGTCDPGKSVCMGNSRQTCSSVGSPLPPVHCDGQACVGGACVGECQPGTRRCDKAKTSTERCSNSGTWETEEKCEGLGEGFSCVPYDDGKGIQPICGECTPGTETAVSRCRTTLKGNTIEECVVEDGTAQWALSEVCPGEEFCFNSKCTSDTKGICSKITNVTFCLNRTTEYSCTAFSDGKKECLREYCEFNNCGDDAPIRGL